MQTIIVQLQHSGNQWSEYARINHAEIHAYNVTPEQVAEYVMANPSPLAKLFQPAPMFRVIVRDEHETSQFSLGA